MAGLIGLRAFKRISGPQIRSRWFCTIKVPDTFYISGYQALQKKRRKIKVSKLEWNPESLTLAQNQWIAESTKPHEVMQIVNESVKSKLPTDQMSTVYNSAIRKCVELEAYPQCWTLFVEAKSSNQITSKTYTTMIWMCLNSAKRAHFNKALELYSEMKQNGFSVSNYTYTALLNGCAKKLCISQGLSIWEDMQNDDAVIPDTTAWNAMITLFCFHKDMHSATQCYYDMKHKAHIVPDNYTFSALLNGFSAAISNAIKHKVEGLDIDQFVVRADEVFCDAVRQWNQSGNRTETANGAQVNEKRMFVFQSWMNVYGAIGDIYAVMAILKWLLNSNGVTMKYAVNTKNQERRAKMEQIEQWLDVLSETGSYPLRVQIFGIALKALLNKSNLREHKLNELIQALMNVMEDECRLTPSTDIYGMLFQLHRRMHSVRSIADLELLFNEMKVKCASKPTERELNEYARTYLSLMEFEGDSQDRRQDFLRKLMSEFRELKVTPSVYTKQLIQE